jgi:hypothetical protein
MQKLFIAFCLLLLACDPGKKLGQNQLSDEQKQNGWQLLFDGKTTKGWHKYGAPGIGTAWRVANGALYLDTTDKNGGDIVTDQEFENFDLKVEWKISKAGNSGIMFYVQENQKYDWPWETGPEMQVLDNIYANDNKKENHLAGSLYDLAGTADRSKPRPVGEWNKAEIVCDKGKLNLFLNDIPVVSTTLWDDNWKTMIANSKFKAMPGFGIFKNGRIALQDHGYMVSYRNVMIKEL